jgi:uncharacterized protein (DUF305 family)
MNIRTSVGSLIALILVVSLSACGSAGGTASIDHSHTGAGATADEGAGDHSHMGHGSAPYDAQFIDSMIVHHQGAVTMAQQAQQEAERPELKQLAEIIIEDQQAEIAQMEQWRQAWYADLAPTTGMGMDMGVMEVADDPSKPYEQRFIEAMIPHHEGAIAMAQDAQQNAERQEIKDFAAHVITAQEAEIAQMKQWQQAWFGQ